MRIATAHLTGVAVAQDFTKASFIDAMNDAQSTTIRSLNNDLYLEFENPELVKTLVARTVFSQDEVAESRYLFLAEERQEVTALVEEAKCLLQEIGPELYFLITQIVGSVAAYRIPQRDGGSVSCCIGLIWLSPQREWNVEYCAEMLVHEFIHNSVFLEDMVRGIMPTPSLLEHEEALSISAIRQTRRPYDKAFHSACVSTGIMYYYHLLGQDSVAFRYLPALIRTLADLTQRYESLLSKQLIVLTENGRKLLDELNQFVANGADFSMIEESLTTQRGLTAATANRG
jgi:hypothetical protein